MAEPDILLGRYRIERRLGRGATGSVYQAFDPLMQRRFAIKVFPNKVDDPAAQRRFQDEVGLAAALNHPNIVALYHLEMFGGQFYLVMEYVPGETLAAVIGRRSPLSIPVKMRWMDDLCDGVGYAHSSGIVHRNIKPANLIIDSNSGRLKILDFGIAQMMGAESDTLDLTGTLRYMALEQIQGSPVDPRSNVFSIGVVFYELLSYTYAFGGSSSSELIHRIAVEEPIPLTTLVPQISPELAAIVERAMRKAPNERFADAGSMHFAIRSALWSLGSRAGDINVDHYDEPAALENVGTERRAPRPPAMPPRQPRAAPRPSSPEQAPLPNSSISRRGRLSEHRPPDSDATRAPSPKPERTERGRYTVWFGTNRQRIDQNGSLLGFSAERDSSIHYGWCRVAIPEAHRIGSTGSPWWRRLLTLTDDRLKVVKVVQLPESEYWAQIATVLRKAPVLEREAVVFLHGFNVSFEQASLRAAQLGYDLGILGVMAFYSWPSKGTLTGYPADEAAIEASEGFITDFLVNMATRSGAARVHVIAHSMGNRALLRAIGRIASRATALTDIPFSQIILAAADVDRDTFARLSASYKSVAQRTTMYVCARDRAVEASHWLHDFPRAGLVPPVLVVPGIDTVNVSNLDLTLLGHGYVAEARDVLQDMHRLIREDSPPDRRFGLRKVLTPQGETYWIVGR